MNGQKYVSIDVIAKFNKVKQLTTDMDLIISVMRTCKNMIVDADGKNVRPNLKMERNTLILRDIPSSTPKAEVQSIFDDVKSGTVTNIRSDIGDTWFVTFENQDQCVDTAMALMGKTFKGKPIRCRVKSENLLRSFYNPFTPKDGAPAAAGARRSFSGYNKQFAPMGGFVPNAAPYFHPQGAAGSAPMYYQPPQWNPNFNYQQQAGNGTNAQNRSSNAQNNNSTNGNSTSTKAQNGKKANTTQKSKKSSSSQSSPSKSSSQSKATTNDVNVNNKEQGKDKQENTKEQGKKAKKGKKGSKDKDSKGGKDNNSNGKSNNKSNKQPELGPEHFPALPTSRKIGGMVAPRPYSQYTREQMSQIIDALNTKAQAGDDKVLAKPSSMESNPVTRETAIDNYQLLNPMPIMYPASPSPLQMPQPGMPMPFLDLNTYHPAMRGIVGGPSNGAGVPVMSAAALAAKPAAPAPSSSPSANKSAASSKRKSKAAASSASSSSSSNGKSNNKNGQQKKNNRNNNNNNNNNNSKNNNNRNNRNNKSKKKGGDKTESKEAAPAPTTQKVIVDKSKPGPPPPPGSLAFIVAQAEAKAAAAAKAKAVAVAAAKAKAAAEKSAAEAKKKAEKLEKEKKKKEAAAKRAVASAAVAAAPVVKRDPNKPTAADIVAGLAKAPKASPLPIVHLKKSSEAKSEEKTSNTKDDSSASSDAPKKPAPVTWATRLNAKKAAAAAEAAAAAASSE